MWNLRCGIAAAAGLGALAAVLLTGCSGPASSGASSAGAPGVAVPHGAGGQSSESNPAGTAQAGGSAPPAKLVPARQAPASAQLVYTAQLTVRVHNLGGAVTQAAAIAADAGGYVSNENTTASPARPATSTADLELKIPVARYRDTLARLSSQLGIQVSLRQQAQDVTQQVADTSSRVTSDEAAISQLRSLLNRTGSVGDLLSVQNQINSEEADLESMQAQQRALNAETSYATVSLSLVAPAAAPVRHQKAPPTLTAGLAGGWHALRTTVSWLLAVLGAVAPWAAVLAILGYLGYLGRRRLLRRRARPADG